MVSRIRGRELLSSEFLERLRAGRELLFARRRRGEMRGRGFGQTPEFERNRPYEPGDDLRYVDWNLYARLERLLLKLFVAEEEGRVSVLVDTSRSMREPPAKALLAARFGAALSYLALASGRALHLGAFSDALVAARGPLRSLQHFPAALHFLGDLPEGAGTDLGSGVGEFLARWRGRHLVFVISDLFQERPAVTVLDELLWRRVEPHLIQVVDDAELAPLLRGHCSVEDVEAGGTLRISAGEDLHLDVRRRIAAYLRDTEEACRRRSIPYLLARTSNDFERLFLGYLFGRGAGG
jgi:uncharacterized protein (DUF58 family)